MTIVFDMAAGSFRSDTHRGHREYGHTGRRGEVVPEHPVPALQEYRPEPTKDRDNIHLIRELLKQR